MRPGDQRPVLPVRAGLPLRRTASTSCSTSELNAGIRRPGLYLFLDLDPAVAAARLDDRARDRWERGGIAARVPQCYQAALHLVETAENAQVARLDAAAAPRDVLAQALCRAGATAARTRRSAPVDYRDLAPEVLIIGSGPAGLFCAGRLREAGAGNILVIEQGKAMRRRTCPDSPLCDCRPCDVLEGEGGAGSFSDGKITLSATRGTHGEELFTPQQARLLGRVEQVIRQFAPAVADYPPVENLAALRGHEDTGLAFSSYPLIHLGSDGIRDFGRAYAAHLEQAGVRLATGTQATELLADDGRVAGVMVRDRHSRARP